MSAELTRPLLLAHNRAAWDERARRRARHTRTASAEDLRQPLRALDPHGWLGDSLAGRRVLCLAAGGGMQSILAAAAGAEVTVVDLSAEMLTLDRRVADEFGLRVRTVTASMDDLRALGDAAFDVVFQPVSTCYVPDVAPVFAEVARVLAAGGVYLSQHKQPVSLQAGFVPGLRGYLIGEPYYRTGPLPPIADGVLHREADTVEFLHRWEDLLGGLCRQGFVIEDVAEPRHADPHAEPGSFGHRSGHFAPYLLIKARRVSSSGVASAPARLWVPGL